MRHRHEVIQASLVLELPEVADFETSCWLKDVLQSALQDFEGMVILNLAKVCSLGSHCIGTIITCAGETAKREQDFRIACPDGVVKKQLIHARLDRILPIYDSVDAALEAPRRTATGGAFRVPTLYRSR